MITFKDLGLSEDLLAGLTKKGFEKPTPIQAAVIPILLEKAQDVIGQAQTGTGKTAAFGLPILDRLKPTSNSIQALILTPTRELTIQVSDELHSLKGNKNVKITPIYGGQSIEKQIAQLRKPNDIIVGTPGRLIDHLKRGKLNLENIDYLILDEADEMLNGGFIEDIEWILDKSNSNRTTLLFSATMPKSVLTLAEKYMKNFKKIEVEKETLDKALTEQLYFEVREKDKLEALCRMIDVEEDFYGLIFCRTKRDVDTVCEKLVNRGYDAESMHGDLSQFQRERVLNKFRKKVCSVLVVTDVASRGLDISGLSHVINFALPQDAESYVHRIGRTGRAGQSGTAITFITPTEYRRLTYIKRVTKAEIKKGAIPTVETIIESKKKRLKEKIQQSTESEMKPDYIQLAEELLALLSPKEALAGVLKVAFEEELSQANYTTITQTTGREKGSREKWDRKDSSNRYDKPWQKGRKNHNPKAFVDTKGQTRLFVAKGKTDEMNVKKLVEYIENTSGVPSKFIQGVELYDKFSFINVSLSDGETILRSFKKGSSRSVVERAK